MGWGAAGIVLAIFWLGIEPGWYRTLIGICASIAVLVSVARESE